VYIDRNKFLVKSGKIPELKDLIKEWREKFPFPKAKSVRYSHSQYTGSQAGSFIFEVEFENLADLEAGWDQWNAMAKDMEPFLEKWDDIIEKQTSSELWKVF
jgi:hypothetical protein